jgi:hypothetical protein
MPVIPAKEFVMNNFSSCGENSGFSVMGRDELESANGGTSVNMLLYLIRELHEYGQQKGK